MQGYISWRYSYARVIDVCILADFSDSDSFDINIKFVKCRFIL